MKKYLAAIIVLLLSLSACAKKDPHVEPNDVSITTRQVDMSVYQGMNSTKHQFQEVNLHDVYTFIEQGGSGVFYIGYSKCASCQEAVQYLNAVAEELGVHVYYIDIDKEEYGVAKDDTVYQEVIAKLGPVLGKNAAGVPAIQTPDVFQLVNGKFADYHIGLTSAWHASRPDAADVASLQEIYRNLLRPFVQQ